MYTRKKVFSVIFYTDDDECLLDTYDCPSNYSHCVNTLGGFKCECNKGYIQNGSACSKYNHLLGLAVWL